HVQRPAGRASRLLRAAARQRQGDPCGEDSHHEGDGPDPDPAPATHLRLIWVADDPLAMTGSTNARSLARGALVLPVVVVALLVGIGWLYVLRGLGWFGFGPRVHDSLPLLQLAGFDAQPLARLAVGWLAT